MIRRNRTTLIVPASDRSHRRPVAPVVAVVLVLGLALGGCSSDKKASPEETGRQAKAVAELRDYGLTKDQATCVADKLGAETVVEASGMDVLAAGQPYQDAAKACIK